MDLLKGLQTDLEILQTERSHLIQTGWCLQHCWLVQVKPGGTARTTRTYWQARSRQPIFDGKKLKHLKTDEVETYRAAIERGRQLKQIDAEISKVQQQLWRAVKKLNRSQPQSESHSPIEQQPASSPAAPESDPSTATLPAQINPDHLTRPEKQPEQLDPDHAIERLISRSQELRTLMQQTIAYKRTLMKENRSLRAQYQQTRSTTRLCSAELLARVKNCMNKSSQTP
ncbi:hypothetical protein [Egbenema bharatensis]|uniref:hypothetical protein n=1 Tax=Egbenema bharatensis TaxID=3463334 RepID=UPI003A8A8673